MRSLFRKRSVRIVLIVLIIIFGIYLITGKKDNGAGALVKVSKGNLTQEVTVTGRVKPSSAVTLAFERSGKIADRYGDVGDIAEPGQILMELYAEDLYAQLAQAEAGVEVAHAQLKQFEAALESQEAKLAELNRGTRTEEIKIAETKTLNAQKSLSDAGSNLEKVQRKADVDIANVYDDVPDTLSDAYAKADDAVRVKTASLIVGDTINGYMPNPTARACDSSKASSVAFSKMELESQLTVWKTKLDGISGASGQTVLDTALTDAKQYAGNIRKFIDNANALITTPCALTYATLNTERTNLSAALTAINAVLAALNTQEQAVSAQKALNDNAVLAAQTQVNNAKNALNSAQDELSLKKSGVVKEQLDFQKAQVKQAKANTASGRAQTKQAQANARNYQAQIAKTIIRAPIGGVITKFDGEAGEVVTANMPVISIMSFAQFEIETNVPEVDIGRLALANPVKITLDALPGETFGGTVTNINPAETIIDGVVNFKVTVAFDVPDARFKSGLTANLAIETARKEGVLILPQYAIVETDKGTFVRKQIEGAAVDIPIQIGIRNQDGNVEIISGVSEGDEVLNIGYKNAGKK